MSGSSIAVIVLVGAVVLAGAALVFVRVRRRKSVVPSPLEWRRGGCGGGDPDLVD